MGVGGIDVYARGGASRARCKAVILADIYIAFITGTVYWKNRPDVKKTCVDDTDISVMVNVNGNVWITI